MSFYTGESSFDTDELETIVAVYAEEAEKMKPDKLRESVLVTQWQPGLERHRPNGTPPDLRTAKDAAGRALDNPKQGLPKINSKDFKTFAALRQDTEEHRWAAGGDREGGTRASQGQYTPPNNGK